MELMNLFIRERLRLNRAEQLLIEELQKALNRIAELERKVRGEAA